MTVMKRGSPEEQVEFARRVASADHLSLYMRDAGLAHKVHAVYRHTDGFSLVMHNGRRLSFSYEDWLTDACLARIALEA